MDYRQQDSYNPYQNQVPDKRSRSMSTAALVLSCIGLFTFTCGYTSIICGALGIILALLSKGGELTCSQQGKIALILGIFSIVAGIAAIVFSFIIVIQQYGSIEGLMKQYQAIYNQYYSAYGAI